MSFSGKIGIAGAGGIESLGLRKQKIRLIEVLAFTELKFIGFLISGSPGRSRADFLQTARKIIRELYCIEC